MTDELQHLQREPEEWKQQYENIVKELARVDLLRPIIFEADKSMVDAALQAKIDRLEGPPGHVAVWLSKKEWAAVAVKLRLGLTGWDGEIVKTIEGAST